MDAVLQLAEGLMASPWLLILVLALAAFDSIVPIVPAETVVITAGAFAVTGSPNIPLLILAAWSGALCGDVIAHHIGRGAGPLTALLRRRPTSGAVIAWAERGLRARGGMLIIAARFIPGGRTAMNVTSGAIGFPRPRFLLFSTIAALAWSSYYVGVGMAGGAVFHHNPLLGVAAGIGLSLLLGGAIELVRWRRDRRRAGLSPRSRAERGACPAPVRDAS